MTSLSITPQRMTPEIMEQLEERGLIIRLTPSREEHRIDVKSGEGKGNYLYKSEKKYGSHSLMNATIDFENFINFGTHPDNEEFLLLGGINEKKMLLLIALIQKDKLSEKIASNTLTSDDFICLEAVFNDPNLSFFVMKKDVPHGECASGCGRPVTFYVTEGSELGLDRTNLGNYKFIVTK